MDTLAFAVARFADKVTSCSSSLSTVVNIADFVSVFGGMGAGTEEVAPIDAFQFGGNIRGGQLGLVGEAGPELFVPNQDGRVVTNTRLEAIMNNALNRATTGEGGGGTTVINAPTNAVTTNSQTHSSPNAVRNNDPFFQRIAGFAI